jgi:hypothetical protein
MCHDETATLFAVDGLRLRDSSQRLPFEYEDLVI